MYKRQENVRFNSYTLEGQQQSGLDFIVYGLPLSPAAVLKEAGAWTMSYARLVVLSFADLVTGRIPVTDLSGPVGIVQTIGQVSTMGMESLLDVYKRQAEFNALSAAQTGTRPWPGTKAFAFSKAGAPWAAARGARLLLWKKTAVCALLYRENHV